MFRNQHLEKLFFVNLLSVFVFGGCGLVETKEKHGTAKDKYDFSSLDSREPVDEGTALISSDVTYIDVYGGDNFTGGHYIFDLNGHTIYWRGFTDGLTPENPDGKWGNKTASLSKTQLTEFSDLTKDLKRVNDPKKACSDDIIEYIHTVHRDASEAFYYVDICVPSMEKPNAYVDHQAFSKLQEFARSFSE